MARVRDEKSYTSNGYMFGTCPGCGEWEAPITNKELKSLSREDKKSHMGSSVPVVDKNAQYYRTTWNEYFKCPVCSKKFSVEYSNV